MTAHVTRLDSVCEINPRMPTTLSDPDVAAFIPMAAVSEDGRIISEEQRTVKEVKGGYTYFERGDVLVAKITPCFENGKATRTTSISRAIGFGSTEFHVLRAGREIDSSYLFHLLWNVKFRELGKNNMIGSAGQKRVPVDFLKRLEIPLPPLDEQRRIAAVLDKADALRRKRKRALDLLYSLTQSIFLEMFVERQPSTWKTRSVSDVSLDIRTGPFGSQLLHSEFVETGICVLGIDNAVQNEFRWKESRFISSAKYQELRRYTVSPGDVLMTIMGTCGRCAIVPDDIPAAINTKHLCCITLNQKECLPEFMHAAFLLHPSVLRQLGVQAKGAVMPGLNMGIIKALSFPLPPLEMQKQFASRVATLRQMRCEVESAGTALAGLFASLQYRAFSGQL